MKRTHPFTAGCLFIGMLLIQSCTEELNASKKNHLYNVSYGPHSRHVMDVCLPANRTPQTPVVIFIHGGAWIMGDKSVFYTEMEELANAGIATVSVHYRFISDLEHIHHPAPVDDIRLAVDFIASKSDEWQISHERFGLVGHSAGGHLAMQTTYTRNGDGIIKACASWAGPLDFTNADQLAIAGAHELFASYTGLPLASTSDSAFYRSASPYWNVDSTSAPTLLIYGTEDPGVPYNNALLMDNRLPVFGVEHMLITLNGSGHIWIGNDLTIARNQTYNWFMQHL